MMFIATFRGKHNEAKSKALITLLEYKERGIGSLTLKQLSRASGVSYEYLKSRLGQWYQWKYVTRCVKNNGHIPVFTYSIAVRGEGFVKTRIPAIILVKYKAELDEYHSKQVAAAKARLARLTKLAITI